jgi:hypothetical protein
VRCPVHLRVRKVRQPLPAVRDPLRQRLPVLLWQIRYRKEEERKRAGREEKKGKWNPGAAAYALCPNTIMISSLPKRLLSSFFTPVSPSQLRQEPLRVPSHGRLLRARLRASVWEVLPHPRPLLD